jgi:hypothetical protein
VESFAADKHRAPARAQSRFTLSMPASMIVRGMHQRQQHFMGARGEHPHRQRGQFDTASPRSELINAVHLGARRRRRVAAPRRICAGGSREKFHRRAAINDGDGLYNLKHTLIVATCVHRH